VIKHFEGGLMPAIGVSENRMTNTKAKSRLSTKAVTAFSIKLAAIVVLLAPVAACGRTVVEWDFAKGTHGWVGNSRVEGFSSSPEGLVFRSVAEDPWIEGPAVDLPAAEATRVRIRMKSNADQAGQLFYGQTFSEPRSVRFTVRNDGKWHDYDLVIQERLGAGTRFRLDPCAGAGEVTVAFITVETISKITAPALEKPLRPDKSRGKPISIKSGSLEFEHYKGKWGSFVFKVNGAEMAAGYQSELIGVLIEDEPEWLNLKDAKVTFNSSPEGMEFVSHALIKDSRGAKWEIERRVKPGSQAGTLAIETQLTVSEDRDVIHIPWLTIFPGLGTFGERKSQGLFAGVEYLCDEPSSSDADVATPEHVRRVPSPIKITFPLMAIAHDGNYIGVIWEPSSMVAATFDSPDRIYNSGSHVMALSAPAVGEIRFENDFSAHSSFRLEANKPLRMSSLIIAGKANSVVPAVKHYVALKGLPELPKFEGGFDAAVSLLAHGWLDSEINHDGLFRHAVWGDSFGAGPAADAAMYIDWLANYAKDRELCDKLNWLKDKALGVIPSGQPFSSIVSHARLPAAPFLFGRVSEFVRQSRDHAMHLLQSFDANGVMLYRPGKTDFSRTHFAKHANGYSGQSMVAILEGATLSADEELTRDALSLLDKQTALYADTVPRGAQTWEVPLHTPDILASAHMVKAYTLGYIISGKTEYLEQARYWAWTGVPFIYLYPPTAGDVGLYATIPVLGATNWRAPVWIGRPVQWCGLVYCSALHLLSQYDSEGPWEKIAKGITVAGLQMSWPLTDKKRQGLLPDVWELEAQLGAGPAINPGTVEAHVPEAYGKGKLYDVKRLANRGWFIHAPCIISNIEQADNTVSFSLDGWGQEPYYVLISGLEKEPAEVNVRTLYEKSGKPDVFESAKSEFHSKYGNLVIALEGRSEVRITY
jgi:hypothetical protein